MFGTYEKPSDLSQLLPQAWQIIWSLGPNGCTSRTLGGGEEDERNEQRTPRRARKRLSGYVSALGSAFFAPNPSL
jgi:hypothetical protein